MNLSDFVAHWQAQPFRAFRLRTLRGDFVVTVPLAVALTPDLHVLLVANHERIEKFSFDQIIEVEVFGAAVSLADSINALLPVELARITRLMERTLAAEAGAPAVPQEKSKKSRATDAAGRFRYAETRGETGTTVVAATLLDPEGAAIFSTEGTRWNLHGVEPFENGTSLYLHHLDHPLVEQRIIVWPPDRGTFESFSEGKALDQLAVELKKRDARLTAKPAKAKVPTAAYFRAITPVYPHVLAFARGASYGGGPDEVEEVDWDRFEVHLVRRATERGVAVGNPAVMDIVAENMVFDLIGSDWDATFERGPMSITLNLRHAALGARTLAMSVDPVELTARVDDAAEQPLAFVERLLRNFALHENAEALFAALAAGPISVREPELTFSVAGGFTCEAWPGERRASLPFLQPHVTDAAGRTLFDLRQSTWAAVMTPDPVKPLLTLRLVSDEMDNRFAPVKLTVVLDLVTQRVTAPALKGVTTLGMLQAMLHHIRGMKWLGEDLPALLAKGKLLPTPK